ncbi:MAG: DUF2953 domain-containing protein [Methanosarcinaceae archaeon]|nr:DUF2953 domain-containing protein [Methanosarcinaceae archaeon]
MVFAAFDVTIYLKVEGGRVDQYFTIKWMGLSHKFKNKNKKSAKKEKKETKKEKTETKPKKEKKKSSIGISVWFRVIKTVQRPVIRFIEDIFRTVKFRKISCNLTYGFSDPGDTGMLSGFLYALKGLFSKRCSIFDFSIYPQFQDEVFDLHVLTNIHFRISSLLFAVLRFVTNTKVLGAAWFIFKEWRKTKPSTNI